jgi:hypothetical protein
MALIDCPECSTQVSSAAPNCPKCGYPIVQEAQRAARDPEAETSEEWKALGETAHDPKPNPPSKPTGTKKMVLVLAVGALVLLSANWYNRARMGTTVPRQQPATVREVPREDSRAWCRDVVHGLAPSLRNLLGAPTVPVQVGLLSTMSCKGISEGFSCVYKGGGPFELRVSDRDKIRGFRFKFTEEAVQGFAAPGCCDGVAEAAETFRRAKFQRYGRDCSLTFGRFPPR